MGDLDIEHHWVLTWIHKNHRFCASWWKTPLLCQKDGPRVWSSCQCAGNKKTEEHVEWHHMYTGFGTLRIKNVWVFSQKKYKENKRMDRMLQLLRDFKDISFFFFNGQDWKIAVKIAYLGDKPTKKCERVITISLRRGCVAMTGWGANGGAFRMAGKVLW